VMTKSQFFHSLTMMMVSVFFVLCAPLGAGRRAATSATLRKSGRVGQAPKPPAGELRPLKIVLAANRKDHGPHEHDYLAWMERWNVLLGGKEAGSGTGEPVRPGGRSLAGPPGGRREREVETARDWPSAEQFAELISCGLHRNRRILE